MFPKSYSLMLEIQLHRLTQDVHPFLHYPLLGVEDGLHAGHIHLEYVQSVLVQAFDTLQKALLLGQVPHRGIDLDRKPRGINVRRWLNVQEKSDGT